MTLRLWHWNMKYEQYPLIGTNKYSLWWNLLGNMNYFYHSINYINELNVRVKRFKNKGSFIFCQIFSSFLFPFFLLSSLSPDDPDKLLLLLFSWYKKHIISLPIFYEITKRLAMIVFKVTFSSRFVLLTLIFYFLGLLVALYFHHHQNPVTSKPYNLSLDR